MKRTKQLTIVLASALGIAAGCASDVIGFGGDGGDGGASTTAAKSSTNTESGVSRGSGINAVGAGDYGPNGPNLASWFEGAQFSANCQPVVGPSPVSGWIKLRYDTIYTPQIATITVARITAIDTNGNLTGEYPIVFTPADTGQVVPGSPVHVTHEVSGAMGDISGICDHCGESLGLELAYDNSGQAGASFALSCTY